jgi:hypothetical protein
VTRQPIVVINNQVVRAPVVPTDRSWKATFARKGAAWKLGADDNELRKKPGLQGPIDDAFMDSFVFVLPSGKGMNPAVEKWVAAESSRASTEWRRHFRGEPRVVRDSEVTDEMRMNSNLVLWGDPTGNQEMAKIAGQLPISWGNEEIELGETKFEREKHVAVMIYPNPSNPKRYVVLNSGVTFREYDYLNNARQVSKLPDYAVLDISVPPNARYAGKVVTAGFFNEKWRLE